MNNVVSVVLLLLVSWVSGQGEYSLADLEVMTEAELEDICIQRGFQLVNDQGDELTKQDYIEAAQRCLAIEQEMNELLTQYPELADELEEEIKRMEKENAEKQAYVEELENQLSNEERGDDEEPGVAFHRGNKVPEEQSNDEMRNDDEEDDLLLSENGATEDATDVSTSTEHRLTSAEISSSEEAESVEAEDVDESNEDIEETVEEESAIESTDNSQKQDLSMTNLAIESLRVLVQNAQDDVRRIINLAIPVFQPLLNAGDAAWRQMKSLFLRARKVYDAYQATSKTPSEDGAVVETCDESIPA